ncbi:hypothetical protein LCGC14_0412380 [marine sediment metagenome]|uniref:Uncharacterized protein n=1 Tax=marine sediment metagenome TaxID=412755 RepID=A0A0F9TBH3_9ZZZZ
MTVTRDDLRTRVRRILGESTPAFWANDEIDDWLVDNIRDVSERVVPDALNPLIGRTQSTYTSGAGYLHLSIANIEPIQFLVYESDGKFGVPWTLVTPDVLQEIRSNEDELAQDSTSTRIYSIFDLAGSGSGGRATFELYPIPVSGRTYRFIYMKKPSESGNMTLPLYLHRLVVDGTVRDAASKKSRNLPLSDRYDGRYERGIVIINREYFNRYGLSGVTVGGVRDVMGGR